MDFKQLRDLMAAYQQVHSQDIEERYKGKHGQSSAEYKDDRSQGGKMVSGDSKMSGAEYTHGRRVKAANPGSQPDEGGKTKPKSQGKMDRGTRADLEYRKANLKKEEVEQIEEKSIQMQRRVDRYLGRDKAKAKERLGRQNDRKVKKAALAALEKHAKGMKAGIYDSYEAEGEQLDEISANLALTASQKADEERRKAAVAGDKERAAAKAQQASRLYKGVGPRRAKERMSEGVRDTDPEKGTAERKARLEKKRGMKLDDHPQYQKEGYGAPGHNPGSGEKSVARAKALMDKQGRKGAPGLDAMAAAKKEHEARRGVKKEELDIFDTVLEYLQVEGIAESFEDAQWVMVNVLDEEDIDSILDEARRADKEGYARGSKENPKRKDIPHGDVSQRSMLHSKLKRRADEMGRERRSSARNKAGGRTPVGKKEKAFLQAVTRTAGQVRQPNVPDTGRHKK